MDHNAKNLFRFQQRIWSNNENGHFLFAGIDKLQLECKHKNFFRKQVTLNERNPISLITYGIGVG